MIFLGVVVVGLHLATASWAVGDSATAQRKLHSSVIVISAMYLVTGFIGKVDA